MEATGGQPAPFERPGSGIAQGTIRRTCYQCAGQRSAEALEVDHGETPLHRQVIRGRCHRRTIQPGTLPGEGGKAFVPTGVIDDAHDRLPPFQQRQRDGKERQAGGEIAGAIHRIKTPDPSVAGPQHAALLRLLHLLAQQRDVRVKLRQFASQAILNRQIGLGNDTAIRLVTALRSMEARQQFLPGDGSNQPGQRVQCDRGGRVGHAPGRPKSSASLRPGSGARIKLSPTRKACT